MTCTFCNKKPSTKIVKLPNLEREARLCEQCQRNMILAELKRLTPERLVEVTDDPITLDE